MLLGRWEIPTIFLEIWTVMFLSRWEIPTIYFIILRVNYEVLGRWKIPTSFWHLSRPQYFKSMSNADLFLEFEYKEYNTMY